ncbi:hypothetical protein P344_00215 [Spiroplasma mirum ATCC 29335]|uniref:Uncharacterized protein n=1 Tax=Spiroplasma mirum ATCC 29335 TaxID=838561 RepID=W6AL45_9MOLU|nr:hypothetical protein P344_00215 [Spiroplasma mirum ATCC 29335]
MSAGLYDFTIAHFFIALLVTVIASLGIACVPGIASVVTTGVLGGLWLRELYMPVYSIIGALDGLFDMGRIGVNVTGRVQATTIATRLTHALESDELLLFNVNGKTLFGKIRAKFHKKKEKKEKLSKMNNFKNYKRGKHSESYYCCYCGNDYRN